MNDAKLELYGTDGCHLCEEAAALLQSLSLSARHIDIAGDDGLVERYGTRIPVLRRADGAELGWPFGAEDVMRFTGAN
ncbi:glutaredoxin family protein [Methylogaea oryzae]|uniref:Glutaredoxin family protein n=1 Tax=Methylogaea oryzae TaxID=1295382 RepID=A0A8D5AK44_9GAMM|nr:glutaredoxin family protein [Methylogaea oryzae]BBL71429.1 glutaredoxin family protein [Methylogaea oryzae]